MIMRVCFTLLLFAFLPSSTPAWGAVLLDHGPLDKAVLHVDVLDRSAPLHVATFGVDQAKLGKAKHQDVARQMAQTVPHLLASDIVVELRSAGFTDVTLDQSESTNADRWFLTGEFTELNPGSQAARVWVGFGAGESKVCVKAELKNGQGKLMGEFAHCAQSLGWGESESQMESSADRLGHNFAQLMNQWANGKYAR